jgi:hypothetical protein
MPSGAVVQFALTGQSDLYGILRGGQLIEVELKNVGKTLKPDQKRWREFCKEWGIPHIVLTARKDETAEQTVERWCGELAALVATTTPASLPPNPAQSP